MTFSEKASKYKFFKCTWNILQDRSHDVRPQNISINLRRLKAYQPSFFKYKFIYFNWRLITLQYHIGHIKHLFQPRHWWKKLKMTQRYGNIYCARGLEKLIPLKWPSTQGNVQIQCNPSQNTKGIFHRTRTYNSKVYMEPQRP